MRKLAVAALLGAALGAAGAWFLARGPTLPPGPIVRTSLALPDGHFVTGLAVSPDGARVVYAADAGSRPQLFVRSLASFDVQPLEGTAGARQPFVSPDGAWVGFFADGKLRKVPIGGGPVQDVCDAPRDSAGGSWGPGDEILFAPLGGGGLVAVPAGGGSPRTLTRPNRAAGEREHGWPEWLPGGAVLFTVSRRARDARLALLDPDTGSWRFLLPAHGAGRFLPPDRLLYTLAGELLTVRIDLDRLDTAGAPATVLEGVAGTFRGFGDLGQARFGVAGDGSLAYVPGRHGDVPTRLVWVTRDGRSSPVSKHAAFHQTPRLAPGDGAAAVAIRSDLLAREIWTYRLDEGTRSVWTRGGSDDHSPVWLLGGRWLGFASNRDGAQRIYRAPLAGAGAAEVVARGSGAYVPASWSDATRTLAFYEIRDQQRDVSILQEPGSAVPVAASDADERSPALSRDGRAVAYVSDASGFDEIYLAATADPSRARRVPVPRATEPVWGHDGQLYFRRADEMLAAVARDEAGEPLGRIHTLFERAVYVADPGANLPGYDVARDGRFLMLEVADRPSEIRFLHGWRPRD